MKDDEITPRYVIESIYPNSEFDLDTTEGIMIKHKDGTILLTGCGDCGSPWTENREKLEELVRLANIQAEEEEWEAHNW